MKPEVRGFHGLRGVQKSEWVVSKHLWQWPGCLDTELGSMRLKTTPYGFCHGAVR